MCRSRGILSLALCVLLLALSAPIYSLPDPSATKPPSFEQPTPQQQLQLSRVLSILLTLRVVSLQLGEDLTQWPQQIKSLQDNSAQLSGQVNSLQTQLNDSQVSLTASQQAQQRTSDALDRSQISLTALSSSFDNYKAAEEQIQAALQAQVAQERASKLKFEIAAGVGVAVIVGIAGYEGGHALKLW